MRLSFKPVKYPIYLTDSRLCSFKSHGFLDVRNKLRNDFIESNLYLIAKDGLLYPVVASIVRFHSQLEESISDNLKKSFKKAEKGLVIQFL
jgi:hypothetical protein